jgi:succinate-acetate transporter protein
MDDRANPAPVGLTGFGMTAFISFGSFWFTLAFILIFQGDGVLNRDIGFFGWYLAIWGLFTLHMFVATVKKNRALQTIFGTLVVLFFLLAIGDWTGNETITKIAGWEGIFCGASAFYLAAAEVINEMYGRTLLPVGD